MSGQGGVMERLQRLDEGPSHCGGEWVMVDTLPDTNISPENGWLEDSIPCEKAYFQGLC